MKTMRKGDTIVRAEEQQVNHYLRNGYSYCPKNEWEDPGPRRTASDSRREAGKEKS